VLPSDGEEQRGKETSWRLMKCLAAGTVGGGGHEGSGVLGHGQQSEPLFDERKNVMKTGVVS